jgi:hypothetical protein
LAEPAAPVGVSAPETSRPVKKPPKTARAAVVVLNTKLVICAPPASAEKVKMVLVGTLSTK